MEFICISLVTTIQYIYQIENGLQKNQADLYVKKQISFSIDYILNNLFAKSDSLNLSSTLIWMTNYN